MSSPSQRRGGCGHMMAGFDPHSHCARCRDKKKGKDPCVEKPDSACKLCDSLSPEQLAQLSTPSYKLKKEKREARSTPSKEPSTEDTLSPSLVDPSLVTVVGVVDGQSTSGSPALSAPPPEKKKKTDSKKSSSKSVKSDKAVKPTTVKSASDRPSSSSTDSRLTNLDQKWSDRFNRLEALLMARTLETSSDQSFTTVKVTPTHAPPAHAIRPEPFLKPSTPSSHTTDPPSTVDPPTTDPVIKHQPAAGTSTSQSSEPAIRPTSQKPPATTFDSARRESSPASDSESDSLSSDRPALELFPEEGELSDEHEFNTSEHDQSLSEEQSYRETMRGIRSYMGWHQVPDLDSSAASAEDNPFAGPKIQTPGKVSVKLPIDEWFCKKMSKLNLTLVQGYPTRTSEAGGLLRDQFVRPARSPGKWYGLHTDPKKDSGDTVSSWNTSSSRLNSTYLRIARQAGIATNPPLSRPISQESLRKWEKSARESSVICNQAAGFNRCLLKIQQSMQSQLKDIRVESKGKSAAKVSTAVDELQYLLDFNSSVCQAMAKSMEHLTDFVFINLANTTLLRRDSYLQYLKAGVKADTLNALRTAPLQLETLFPDTVIKCAEEEISSFDKGRGSSVYKKRRFHPYEREESRSDSRRQDRPAWKNLSRGHHKKGKGKQQFSS